MSNALHRDGPAEMQAHAIVSSGICLYLWVDLVRQRLKIY